MTAGPAVPPSATLGRLTGQDVSAPQQRVWGHSPSAGPEERRRRTQSSGFDGEEDPWAPLPPRGRWAARHWVGGAGRGWAEPGRRERLVGLAPSEPPWARWGLEACGPRAIGHSGEHDALPGRGQRDHSCGRTRRGTRSPRRAGKRAGTVRPRGLFKTVSVLTPTVSNLAPGPWRNRELAWKK